MSSHVPALPTGWVFVNKKSFKETISWLNKEEIIIEKKHSHPGKMG